MRSWLVVPAAGIAAGGTALALGLSPALALTGAALAAAVRALAGGSPAALAAAALAPLLAVASLGEAGDAPLRAALALAAAGWAIAELARPTAPALPPTAVIPAVVAAVLDPSFVALVAIAGARLVTAPVRPRWALAVPVAGALAIALAAASGTRWPALGAAWFARPAHPVDARSLAALVGAALGPLTAVAALAGLAPLVRARLAGLAVAAAVAGGLLVDLRAGAPGVATLGLAALLAGLALARLAGMIRIPSGQAIAGATLAALVIAPPAWTAVQQRAAAAHTGHASR